MVFFDAGRRRLGAGEVGSANLAASAVYTPKLGTFSLAKAIGTLENASIGSISAAYGSFGTHAGHKFRALVGSFIGSVVAPVLRGRYGSLSGTLVAPTLRGEHGSFGSAQVKRLVGQTSWMGTPAPGAGDARSKAGMAAFAGPGSRAFHTLRQDASGRTHWVAYGGSSQLWSFVSQGGTMQVGIRGVEAYDLGPRVGSQVGTLIASAGVRSWGVGSFGSHLGHVARFAQGSFLGSVYAHVGSVKRFAGSMRAAGITSGTIGVARLPSLGGAYVGTLAAARLPSLGGAYVGTLANARLPRNVSVGTLAGVYGSLRHDVAGTTPVVLLLQNYGSVSKRTGVWVRFIALRGGDTGQDYMGMRFRVLGTTVNAEKGGFGLIGMVGGGVLSEWWTAVGGSVGHGTMGPGAKYDLVGNMRIQQLIGGTVPAARVSTGTVSVARLFQRVGTHLNGSFVGGTTRTRYVVWPSAFPAAGYGVWMGFQLRGTNAPVSSGQQQFHGGFLGPKAGSSRFYVGLDSGPSAVGTVQPPGTVWLYGA